MKNELLGKKTKKENENIINNEININKDKNSINKENTHCLYKEWNYKYKCYKYCKFPICKNKNNLSFCGNHLPLGEEGPNGIMIKCEICKQNIGSNILETHLKKCNKNKDKKYKEISNENIITPRLWIKKEIKISDIEQNKLEEITKKIEIMYDKINPNYDKNILLNEEILNKFSKEETTGKNSKNLNQEISIYCNALKENFFSLEDDKDNSKTLIIELGCGAGGLSKTFQLCNDNENNFSYLLIDRMKYRAKNRYDNFIKSKLTKGTLVREVIDIKDLSLNNYINLYDNFIFISKHLCGEACELSLNKIINIIKESKNNTNFVNKNFNIIIATCCHYLLNNETYCNYKLFENYNFNKEDFNLMTRISSWGTLKEEEEKNYKSGKKVKMLLDYGRCEYLKENGFQKVILIQYIDSSITKENFLILTKY